LLRSKKLSPAGHSTKTAYLHLLLGAFGAHFGYTLEEAKLIYKQLNKEVYCTKSKSGEDVGVLAQQRGSRPRRKWPKSIDHPHAMVRAEHGYKLPPATDQEWLRQIENEIERSGYYL
jgi:hypothetical protein